MVIFIIVFVNGVKMEYMFYMFYIHVVAMAQEYIF